MGGAKCCWGVEFDAGVGPTATSCLPRGVGLVCLGKEGDWDG